jgi:hypothetical protein
MTSTEHFLRAGLWAFLALCRQWYTATLAHIASTNPNGHAPCRSPAPAAPAEPPGDYRERFEALTGRSLRQCPHCHAGTMVVIDSIMRPRGPPAGSGHIMTQERRSNHANPKRPPAGAETLAPRAPSAFRREGQIVRSRLC